MRIQGIAASPGVAVACTKRVDQAPEGLWTNPTPFEASTEVDATTLGLLLQHLQRRLESLIRSHITTSNSRGPQAINNLQDLWNALWPQEWLTTSPSKSLGGSPSAAWNDVGLAHSDDRPQVSITQPEVPPSSTLSESQENSDCSHAGPGIPAKGFIAIAESMTAEALRRNWQEGAVGVIVERCGWHSDTMLLARSLGIPLVFGLGNEARHITDHMPVVLDGTRGLVHLPDSSTPPGSAPMVPDAPASQPESPEVISAVTRDGITIRLLLTLECVHSASPQLLSVADGVGLWRCDRAHWHNAPPATVDEFLRTYRSAADLLPGQELQMELCRSGESCRHALDRDFDSDRSDSKSNTGLHHHKISAKAPQDWAPQAQALCELAKEHHVTILLSGMNCPATIQSTISALVAMVDGVERGAIPFRIGVLLESPSAALTASEWLPLVQSLTVDWDSLARNMAGLDDWQTPADPLIACLAPPVLRLLQGLAEVSTDRGIPLTLTAHLLGNPSVTAVALATGIRRLSVSPWSFRSTQQTIAQISVRGLGELRNLICSQASAMEIMDWLRENLGR
jgi:phosphoenolpyruvate-protein kinase (PTS system EI component)